MCRCVTGCGCVAVQAINAAGSAKAAAASPVAPTAIKKTFQDKKSEKEAVSLPCRRQRVSSPAESDGTLANCCRRASQIDSQIATLKGKLAKDFGVDFKFASMDGNCFESDSGHFTYKFCGFDKVEQKDGASWNNLGAWGSWVDAVKKCAAHRQPLSLPLSKQSPPKPHPKPPLASSTAQYTVQQEQSARVA